jgi:hypothetical protein
VVFTFVNNYSDNVSKDYFDIYVTDLNRRVTMKQLLLLLTISIISITSWSICAKSTEIQINNLYIQPSSTANSLLLKPYLSNQLVNENFSLMRAKDAISHNNFFENTMIFNEKLQQLIAYFNDSHNEMKEVANNNLQSSKNNTQKCKASS